MDGWTIGNNDTHQNNTAESWSGATWLCNDNEHSFTFRKQSNRPKGLCNTTESQELLSYWWLGCFVPDGGHHGNYVKQVSFRLVNVAATARTNHFRK